MLLLPLERMDVLLIYCDSGAPSRWLRFLEVGVYHQVLADNQFEVTSRLVCAQEGVEGVAEEFRTRPARFVGVMFDEFNSAASFAVIRRLRDLQPTLPVAAFGIYPVLAPEKIFDSGLLDYMIVGEGEIALYELATTILRKGDLRSVKNLWYRQQGRIERNPLRPLQENLDLLPYPDRSLFAQDPTCLPFSEKTLYVAASRGCPYECLFCYSPILKRAYSGKGSFYRIRTAQNVVAEILGELRRNTYARVVFADEMFPADRMWLRDLAKKMAHTNIPPAEAVVAADKFDADILDQLAQAGIRRLVLGLETGSDAFRRRIAGRNHGNEKIQAAMALARERGVGVALTTMIGLPLESAALAEETYTTARALVPDEVRCAVYQPIEGTQLDTLVREQKLKAPDAASPDFSRVAVQLPDFPPEAVRQLLYKLRFLDLSERLRSVPVPPDSYCFLKELPKAKFRLNRSSSMTVGTTERNSGRVGYLALEAGSECRYAVSLSRGAVLQFALSASETAIRSLRSTNGFLVAEVAWEPQNGEAQVLFSRMVTPNEGSLARTWRDCMVFGPDEGGAGQLVFRVLAMPRAEAGQFLFWADPVLTSTAALGSGSSPHADLEGKLDAAAAEAAALRQDLEKLRQAEQAARQERDSKSQRIGELQIRIIELEKQLQEQTAILQQFQSEGMAGKLKGFFRK